MARVTVRAFAKSLSVSHTHILRKITAGIVERGADGLVDEDLARAALAANRSVAHAYLDEVNERQRAAHRRGKPAAAAPPLPPSAGAAAGAAAPPPMPRAKNRKPAPPAPTAGAAQDLPIDPGPAPDPAMAASIAVRRQFDNARSDRERATADLARLEYQRKTGELIARVTAERVLFNCARRARDAWMRFPTQAAPLIAASVGMGDPEPLRQALTEQVARLLEKLGGDTPDFDDADA